MTLHSALIAFLLQVVPGAGPAPSNASIAGVVVNSSNGAPLEGVRVTLARTDMPVGAFGMFAGGSSTEMTISADTLAAMKAEVEAQALDAGASPELAARSAELKDVPLEDILAIVVSPMSGPAAVLKLAPPTTTDGRGRFAFDGVPAGTYRLTFSSNGYARQEYGQRIPVGSGVPVALRPGQAKTDIVMKMAPVGAVSGRIRDAHGQPVAAVPVQIFRSLYDSAGRKQIQRVAATVTDDRGEYRMFYLSPGRYYLSAGYQAGQTRPAQPPRGLGDSGTGYVSLNQPTQTLGLTYYPGVTDERSAGVLEIQPGADLRGIDLFVDVPQAHRVRGRVVDPVAGRPPQSATITMDIQTDDITLSFSDTRNTPNYKPSDGTFEVENVSPGTYTITASPGNQGPGIPMTANTSNMSPAELNAYFESMTAVVRARPRATAIVTIGNADVDDIVLTFSTSSPISGRFRIDSPDPGKPVQFGVLNLQFKRLGNNSGVIRLSDDPMYQTASTDGTFRIDNVLPGEYRLSVSGLPTGFYVKDAKLGDTNVLGGRVVFSGSRSGVLDILLSSRVGAIDGTTTDAIGQPMPGAQVVLIPNSNRERTELFRPVVADSNGHFTIPSVAPGEYTLAAWEAIEPYAFFDPEFIAQAEQTGKPLRVSENSSQTLNVIANLLPGR